MYKEKSPKIELMDGESAPFAHPFGDYVETTSYQRLQFRAERLLFINPNYLIMDPLKYDAKIAKKYDNINRWRFIIENVYKISENNFMEFWELYNKHRHAILECKKYFKDIIIGRSHFYGEGGLSPALRKLEQKQLFYF